jgi:hypothetical protein
VASLNTKSSLPRVDLRAMAKSAMLIKQNQGSLFHPGALDRIMKDLPETCEQKFSTQYMDMLDKKFQAEEKVQFAGDAR